MTRVLERGDHPAAAVNRSAVLLSCDEAKSPGTDGGPCLSISVTAAWVFLPSGPSHTQQHSTLTRPGPPCHKHVRLILGLMSASLEDLRGNAVPRPLHGCLNTCFGCNLDKCMHGQMKTCKEGHTCSLRTHTFSLPLSVCGACMVASWWVQLEFHTQLGSSL